MNRLGWISTLVGLVFGLMLWTAPPVWAAATCNANIRATTPTGDFTLDDGNGTATHLKTGLIWMRCALGQNWDSANKTCTGSPSAYNWGAALRAARGYSFAGYSDWRLPNAKELATIVEEHCYGPSINQIVFPGMSSDWYYWSSSTDAYHPAPAAWYVSFVSGYVSVRSKSLDSHARLVRGGQWFDDYVGVSQTPWEEPPEQYEGGVSCMGGTCSNQSIATKAVVIVHGWNSSADADWVVGMATAICQKLGAANTLGKDNITHGHLNQWCHTPQWDVWVKDWAMGTIPYCRMNLSLCLIPKTVWSQAPVIGQEVATQLIPFGYQHIHFIAHSAGSNLIHNATLQLKNQSTAPTIHETFLDAYDGWVESAESPFEGMQRSQTKYGEKADWADNYVDTRTLFVKWADHTKLLLNKVYNVDVTPQTDNCEDVGGILDDDVCRHGWPYRFYTGSITGDFDTGGIMGFPLSLEAGETIQGLNDKYPLTARVRAIFEVSQFPGSYTLAKSGLAECSFSSGWVCGYVDLKTSLKPAQSQSQQFSFFAQAVAATVPSQEPAWLVAQIQVTEPINNLRFAYRFAPGGEGLLRIFVDENTVREIDQRFVPAVSSEPVSIYVGDLAPGTHKIAFRLDGYGANPGGVQLTDVQLGRQTFVVENNLLTVAKAGTGNGTVTSTPEGINCGETCSANFDSGASIALTASPSADSTFAGWSPDSCGSPFALAVDTTCTATFNRINQPPTANAGDDQTVLKGRRVTLSGSGSDPDNGLSPLTFSWTQSGGPTVSLTGADTAKPTFMANEVGTYTFTLTVNDGLATATDSVQVVVIYDFAGFFPPVDNPPAWNKAKAGSAIPVKFSLGGDQGLAIFQANSPASQPIACESATSTDALEETATAGTSGLNYDPATDTYNYVWKTDKAWGGTCRQLIVKLIDDTSHTALFKFVK